MTSRLVIWAAGAGGVGLLNPSVAYVEIDESQDKLHILAGQSGGFESADPGAGQRQVLVNGVDLGGQIESWSDGEIVISDFPRSGTASAGKVEVVIRGHRSNPRWITSFSGVRLVATEDWDGTLFRRMEWNVRIRADVGTWRQQPGFLPEGRIFQTVSPAAGQEFSYAVGGDYLDTNDTAPTQDDCLRAWRSLDAAVEPHAPDIAHAGDLVENTFCVYADFQTGRIRLSPSVHIPEAQMESLGCPPDGPSPQEYPLSIGGPSVMYRPSGAGEDAYLDLSATGWEMEVRTGTFTAFDGLGMLTLEVFPPESVEFWPEEETPR